MKCRPLWTSMRMSMRTRMRIFVRTRTCKDQGEGTVQATPNHTPTSTHRRERNSTTQRSNGAPPPAARPLAAFLTPQVPARPTSGVPRYSIGGPARRVPLQDSPWKVRDLVLPPLAPAPSSRPRISDDERRAISEQRRSALRAPDAYFGGGVPGLSPVRRLPRVREYAVSEDQDSRTLLASLRETVEGLRMRRESVLAEAAGKGRRLVADGRVSLLANEEEDDMGFRLAGVTLTGGQEQTLMPVADSEEEMETRTATRGTELEREHVQPIAKPRRGRKASAEPTAPARNTPIAADDSEEGDALDSLPAVGGKSTVKEAAGAGEKGNTNAAATGTARVLRSRKGAVQVKVKEQELEAPVPITARRMTRARTRTRT
ncbi:hypothetical protein B0H17DRAFT_1043074 [Mycena rosella]|uniref:Uncharacterized protein n=1 Tax=Mycena rosella TaxID=1033263 RepID=A0AAD7GR02_MYCRO|nr:hypothetical protein B0H17DRAFT_1043074 [Mycena rosella]